MWSWWCENCMAVFKSCALLARYIIFRLDCYFLEYRLLLELSGNTFFLGLDEVCASVAVYLGACVYVKSACLESLQIPEQQQRRERNSNGSLVLPRPRTARVTSRRGGDDNRIIEETQTSTDAGQDC